VKHPERPSAAAIRIPEHTMMFLARDNISGYIGTGTVPLKVEQ